MATRDADRYERFERAVEIPMLLLSLVFLVALIVPEVSDLTDEARTALNLVEYLIWGAFAGEVAVLTVIAPSARRMVRDHWLDILIVAAPFLRPLRLARLLRVVRAGSTLGRLLTALSRVTSRKGFQAYGALALVVIAGSGVLVWAFERAEADANITSVGDGIWWATVTAATVGYGDRFPISGAGRGIAVLVMVVGIGLLGVVTANVTAVFVGDETDKELADVRAQLDRIEALIRGQQ